MGMKLLKPISGITVIIMVVAVASPKCQDIFLNSYSVPEHQLPANVMYKISLGDLRVADSLILDCRGAYFDKYPIELDTPGNSFLLNFIENGLPAKNAYPPKGKWDTYYFIIDRVSFEVAYFDSLPSRGMAGIEKISENRISYRWIDEDNHNRPIQEDQIGIGDDRRLRVFSSHDYGRPDFSQNDIGEFANPQRLSNVADTTVYWDLGSSSSSVYLFEHNPAAGIINQVEVGDRAEMNIVLGYSEATNTIYCFTTPFKLYSFSPPIYSADTLNMIIRSYNARTLTEIDSVLVPVGQAFAANEVGTARDLGPYLYYYYFWQDGYQRFDPAYLLIFDTRTNEASWLRVGWR